MSSLSSITIFPVTPRITFIVLVSYLKIFQKLSINFFYLSNKGRTGRSNNKGTSYTFFTPSNSGKVDELINILNETNQYINPELYQMKKYRGGNNRRGGGGNRFGGKSGGYGNKSYGQNSGGYKGAGGSGYGRSNYENGGGYNNGAGTSTRSHTRFDGGAGGYSNGGASRFQ
jgi:ATP-dependent RNA helicase DDX5/DBP2